MGWLISAALIGVLFYYDSEVAHYVSFNPDELRQLALGCFLGLSAGFVVHSLSIDS